METKTKILNILRRIGNYILLISTLIAGFFIGRLSNQILEDPVALAPPIKTMHEISIAVNESNDMLIIDRRDGNYEMYSDSVGLTIFRMYANRIKSQVTSPQTVEK
jgi:hypothetical protein